MIAPPLRLRDDVIIRPFDGAGRDLRFIAAVDGRHYLLSEPVALFLELTRQRFSSAAIAERMSARFGRRFEVEELDVAVRTRVPAVLVGAGVCAKRRSPLLLQRRIVGAATLKPLLQAARGLFHPWAVAVVAILFCLLDLLIAREIAHSGLAGLSSASVLLVVPLVLAGVLVHEVGHLCACHRFGAHHGGIGIGLYWGMPVLYAEVHGAWLLGRVQRAVVDIAGVYFQCAYLALVAGAWLLQPSGSLLAALWISHFLVLNTLNPVMKYDGYWLLSDLSGRPNFHEFVRGTARAAVAVIRRQPGAKMPAPAPLAMLAAFALLASVYFSYLILFMGHNLAYSASALQAQETIWAKVPASLAVAMLTVASVGISLLLARALHSILGGSSHAVR